MELDWCPPSEEPHKSSEPGAKRESSCVSGPLPRSCSPLSAVRPWVLPAKTTGTQVLNHLLRSLLILNFPFVSWRLCELFICVFFALLSAWPPRTWALAESPLISRTVSFSDCSCELDPSAWLVFPFLRIWSALASATQSFRICLSSWVSSWSSSQINLMITCWVLGVSKALCNLCER